MNDIVIPGDNPILSPVVDLAIHSGTMKSRLISFVDFMGENPWWKPDFAGYVEHLRQRGNAETTISSHLSTVRERYRQLVLDRDLLYSIVDRHGYRGLAMRKLLVDEIEKRILNECDRKIKLDITTVQDESDLTHIRLSKTQADELLRQPGIMTKSGARNTAMIAVMLCTGVREQELVDLTVEDLEQQLSGETALRVSAGKGNKQRLIPYGELIWCLSFVQNWMRLAGITEGVIFRRIRKGGHVGTNPLTTRAVEMMMTAYKVHHDRRVISPRPHDLRRTYARRLWEEGVEIVRIQQNLGHANLKTTLRYIGLLDGKQRRPPAIYAAPVDLLELMEQ